MTIMVFFVYILICWNEDKQDSTLYTGFTNNLSRRLKEHKTQGYTKRFENMEYGYFEKSMTRAQARQREIFIKQQSRAWKLDLIKKGR